jgi:hypothetical protein
MNEALKKASCSASPLENMRSNHENQLSHTRKNFTKIETQEHLNRTQQNPKNLYLIKKIILIKYLGKLWRYCEIYTLRHSKPRGVSEPHVVTICKAWLTPPWHPNSHRLQYFTREVPVFDVGPVNSTITVIFFPSAVQILWPMINSGSYSTVKCRRGNALLDTHPCGVDKSTLLLITWSGTPRSSYWVRDMHAMRNFKKIYVTQLKINDYVYKIRI